MSRSFLSYPVYLAAEMILLSCPGSNDLAAATALSYVWLSNLDAPGIYRLSELTYREFLRVLTSS